MILLEIYNQAIHLRYQSFALQLRSRYQLRQVQFSIWPLLSDNLHLIILTDLNQVIPTVWYRLIKLLQLPREQFKLPVLALLKAVQNLKLITMGKVVWDSLTTIY